MKIPHKPGRCDVGALGEPPQFPVLVDGEKSGYPRFVEVRFEFPERAASDLQEMLELAVRASEPLGDVRRRRPARVEQLIAEIAMHCDVRALRNRNYLVAKLLGKPPAIEFTIVS